jgi:hypothetical protein
VAASPCATTDLRNHLFERRVAEKREVPSRSKIRDARDVTVVEVDLDTLATVPINLALIQMLEYIGLNQECASEAAFTLCFDKGNDPSRIALHTPVIMRTLPEPSFPATDMGAAGLLISEILAPDQRAVTEDPNRLASINEISHTSAPDYICVIRSSLHHHRTRDALIYTRTYTVIANASATQEERAAPDTEVG